MWQLPALLRSGYKGVGLVARTSALPERSLEKKPTDKTQPNTLLTIVGSIYLQDSSITTSLTTLSDLLLTFSNRLLTLVFDVHFLFQHLEQPIPRCYMTSILKLIFNKRGTKQKCLVMTAGLSRTHKQLQSERDNDADWTQHDLRVIQEWLFAQSKHFPQPLNAWPWHTGPIWMSKLERNAVLPQLPTLFI